MARHYDRKHQPMELTGAVYLHLSKPTDIGYKFADTNKLSIVKEGPFRIKRRVGKYAYELELPERLKHIYPVISIAHLEQATEDTYYCKINLPGPVIVDEEEHYVLDRITGKEKRGKKSFYRIKWTGYDTQTWEPAEAIADQAPEAVQRYERRRC